MANHPITHLRFTPITADEARVVLTWEYPGLPTLYHPVPDELEEDIQVLLTPAYNYYAARNSAGMLVGFCCFGEDAQVPGGDYSLPAVDVGLGMNPALIGKGLSHALLAAVLDWGRQLFDLNCFRATVAAINVRSLGLFSRAGFMVVQRFVALGGEPHEFLVLLRAERESDITNA